LDVCVGSLQVVAKQGIAGLYSGVQAAFVGSIISSSVYFGTYELGKGIFTSIGNCPKTLVPPLAAALGNITSSAVLVPKEVVKQRMQAGMVGSALEVFLQTIRSEGVGGLYAGYSAALLRNLPSNIISFSTFVSPHYSSPHLFLNQRCMLTHQDSLHQ
jgi:solute carrier family 25 S-adenosylmethionine transporter 26